MDVTAVAIYRGIPVGRRIHVTGNSCSGKSTLASQLASTLDVPLVELDALNWQPGWVVSGSYMAFSQRICWPRVETVVWLDVPVPRLLWRVLVRSWKRWRSKELLWGTNYERFWPQLKVWNREDSLVWWIVTQQGRKRRRMQACMQDPDWGHIAFVRLGSNAEIEAFLHAVKGIRH